MSRPQITISEDRIEVVSERYRLTLEFPAAIDPAAAMLWGKGFEDAKRVMPTAPPPAPSRKVGTGSEGGEMATAPPSPLKEESQRTAVKPISASTGKPTRANTGTKICRKCGSEYLSSSNAQRYCANCKGGSKKRLDETDVRPSLQTKNQNDNEKTNTPY